MNLGDQFFVFFGLDVHHHHLDVTENPGAVVTETLEVVDAHVREVLDLDVRVFREQAGDRK